MAMSKFAQADSEYLRGLKAPQVVQMLAEATPEEGVSTLTLLMRQIFCCSSRGGRPRPTEGEEESSLRRCSAVSSVAAAGTPKRASVGGGVASAGEPGGKSPFVNFVKSDEYGNGTGGTPFDQLATLYVDVTRYRISKAVGYYGGTLHGLSLWYEGVPAEQFQVFGYNGGNRKEIEVPSGDPIVGADVFIQGQCALTGLRFILKSGKQTDVLGEATDFPQHSRGAGRPLAYIFGHAEGLAGNLLSIGFAYQSMMEPPAVAGPYGPDKMGLPFEDLPFVPDQYTNHPLSAVFLTTCRSDSHITSIQLRYKDLPRSETPHIHGGSGDDGAHFYVNPEVEFICKVGVAADEWCVRNISFETNTGRLFTTQVPTSPGIWKYSSEGKLLAIGGTADLYGTLRSIKLYWAPAPEIEYSDFKFDVPGSGFAETPVHVGTLGPLMNYTNLNQQLSETVSWEMTRETTITTSDAYEVGAKITFKFESILGLINVSNEVELSFAYTHSDQKSFTSSTTHTVETEFTAAVPPMSSMKASVMVYHQACTDVSFTANKYQVVTRADQTVSRVFLGTISGKYSGVDAYRATAEWQKPVPLQ